MLYREVEAQRLEALADTLSVAHAAKPDRARDQWLRAAASLRRPTPSSPKAVVTRMLSRLNIPVRPAPPSEEKT